MSQNTRSIDLELDLKISSDQRPDRGGERRKLGSRVWGGIREWLGEHASAAAAMTAGERERERTGLLEGGGTWEEDSLIFRGIYGISHGFSSCVR